MTTNIAAVSGSSNQLVFPRGIPGFEGLTHYTLYHTDTESGRVYWMESRDRPEIVFTFVDPEMYGLNYVLGLSDEEQALLQAERPDDVVVLLMLWKEDDAAQSGRQGLNANLVGPILINVERGIGMQKMITAPKVELTISD